MIVAPLQEGVHRWPSYILSCDPHAVDAPSRVMRSELAEDAPAVKRADRQRVVDVKISQSWFVA